MIHCPLFPFIALLPTLLQVVGGYMREADLAVAQVEVPEEFVLTAGRLGAWPSLLLSHALVPNASLAGHLCGVAAGVLHMYAARALAWAWRLWWRCCCYRCRAGLRQRLPCWPWPHI